MTNKMTLLLVKKTGHVLGVVTRESDPEGTLEPADIAGEELLVRFAGRAADTPFAVAQFFVPAAELAVEVKDLDPVVVTRPREFYLNADKQVAGAAGAVPTVTLSGNTQINVDLAANVTAKTPVWIQVSAAADLTRTQVRQADIDVNQDDVDLEVLPLNSGLHYVLTLVAGHEQVVREINVP